MATDAAAAAREVEFEAAEALRIQEDRSEALHGATIW